MVQCWMVSRVRWIVTHTYIVTSAGWSAMEIVTEHTAYFHLYITFPPLQIPQPHNTPLQHPMRHLWACMFAHLHHPTLIGPITNHTIRLASCTDPAVTFPFLDRSPHCFLTISSLFYFTDLPPWYPTARLSYPTHPDAGRLVLNHCATQSVIQGTVAILPQMILVLVPVIIIFVFIVFCIQPFPHHFFTHKCTSLWSVISHPILDGFS